MDLDPPTIIQAASGVAAAALVATASKTAQAGGLVQILAGAVGGVGGGWALSPLLRDAMTGMPLTGYGDILANALSGALGGGALVVLVGAILGGSRR